MKIKWQDVLLFFVIGVIYLITVELEDIRAVVLILLIVPYTGLVFIFMFLPQKKKGSKKVKAGGIKKTTLMFCPKCMVGLLLILENQAPKFTVEGEILANDHKEFLIKHKHASLETLSVIMSLRMKRVPLSQPVRDMLLLARAKEVKFSPNKLFLIKRGRKNVNEPFQYEVSSLFRWKTLVMFVKMAMGWIFG